MIDGHYDEAFEVEYFRRRLLHAHQRHAMDLKLLVMTSSVSVGIIPKSLLTMAMSTMAQVSAGSVNKNGMNSLWQTPLKL